MNPLFWFAAVAGTTVVTYYTTTFVQVVFHRWFGHERRLGEVYDNHIRGHHADYRGEKLMSERYIEAERHVMWYYALPLAPLTVAAACWLPWTLVAAHVATLVATIWWHLHLHRQYHLTNPFWARFAWFRKKRALHLRHHVHHHGNYAIVEFFWDRLLGTYDASPAPATAAPTPDARATE